MKKEINKNNLLTLILIFVLIYGGSQGWFKKTTNVTNMYETTNQETINQLQPTGGCSLTIPKDTACIGESVSSSIEGEPNANCLIYYKYNNEPWKFYATVTLNPSGDYEATDSAGYAGTYYWIAACGSCVTNYDIITITDCSDNDNNDDGDGEPLIYCQSSWPPVYSQLDCNARVGCPTNNYCKFYGTTTVAPAHCSCEVPTSCDDYCRKAGLNLGVCGVAMMGGQPVRNPCANIGTHYSAYDQYCPISNFNMHDWCCCS